MSFSMFILLMAAYSVSASVKSSLPRLIASSRVSRGYALEDRVTHETKIGASIGAIPYIPAHVKDIIKETTLGYYDVFHIIRRLHAAFSTLESYQMKGLQPDYTTIRWTHEISVTGPKQVTKLLDHVISCVKRLPSWNAELDARVSSLLTNMKHSLSSITSSLEALTKHATPAKVERARIALRQEASSAIFKPLVECIHSLLRRVADFSEPAERFKYTERLLKAMEESNRYIPLVWRLNQRAFLTSLVARNSCACSALQLARVLSIERASDVTATNSRFHCFPSLELSPDDFPFPGYEEVLDTIVKRNEEWCRLSRALEDGTGPLNPISLAVTNRQATATQLAQAEKISKRLRTISQSLETSYLALNKARREYASRGHTHYQG